MFWYVYIFMLVTSLFWGIFSNYFIIELKREIKFEFKSANELFDWGVLENMARYQKVLNKTRK